jgi:hypothetical protein
MTDDSIALRELLEKSADADLLREMIGFAAERLMELEVQGLTGARYGARSPDRLAQRNATGSGTGRPAPGRSSCASPSSARAATSRASWNRGGSRRRR